MRDLDGAQPPTPATSASAGGPGGLDEGVMVGNEFAAVRVSIDRTGRVARVLLCDVRSGQARLIDPLVLEALIFMSDEQMERLADPNLVVGEA